MGFRSVPPELHVCRGGSQPNVFPDSEDLVVADPKSELLHMPIVRSRMIASPLGVMQVRSEIIAASFSLTPQATFW